MSNLLYIEPPLITELGDLKLKTVIKSDQAVGVAFYEIDDALKLLIHAMVYIDSTNWILSHQPYYASGEQLEPLNKILTKYTIDPNLGELGVVYFNKIEST